jgi:renalase
MAARVLHEEGFTIQVVDKGRSVGGRLATRRIGAGQADHGAQFFTVREPEFQAWVDDWLADDLAFTWSRGWSDGSLHRSPPDGHPRYAIRGGMNRLAKILAEDLPVTLEAEAASVLNTDAGWTLRTVGGDTFTGRALVMTPPAPQTLNLLKAGAVDLPLDELATVQGLTYAPCLAGLFWIEGPFYMPVPGAIQRANMPVRWIADNQRKGISDKACIVTVHTAPDYSRDFWDARDETILDEMRRSFELFMGPKAIIREQQVKRWRYSLPETTFPDRCLVSGGSLPPLVFAGDAFGGPRVEGAALSGLAAGQAVAAQLRAGV